MTQRSLIIPLIIVTALSLGSCTWYSNRMAYFNTYYNIGRIMSEAEDQFVFHDEGKRTKPRVLVPGSDEFTQNAETAPGNTMNFLQAFVIERAKLQPVQTKVDSVLIKGSKILANHGQTEYVEGTLFNMSKAYFFRSEWVASQQKCVEMVEKFPEGEYSPDGHLLLAKNYLLQRKISQGEVALSKCIDVAWYKERYDILSEAYRIQAEMAIEAGDLNKAVQPYKQAVAQSEDGEQRAKWQVDVASIYYRAGKFDLAEKAFSEVFEYTPDAVATFEAKLYRAASLTQLKRYDEAKEILDDMEDNRSYEEWKSFVAAEQLALERAKNPDPENETVLAQERKTDTSFVGRPEVLAQNFQKGMELYKQGRYSEALPYFARAKVIRTPVYEVANKYFGLIKQWEDQHRKIKTLSFVDKAAMRDTMATLRSKEVYALGRVFEQFGDTDSALHYYRLAHDSTAETDVEKSRYLFAQSRLIRQTDPETADSLLEVITERYPTSQYGRQANGDLGFSSDAIVDDDAEMFRSAGSFRRIGEYDMASTRYNAIVRDYPQGAYAARALYALGWMYEREMINPDSSRYYYQLLVDRYPTSEYARDIRPSLEFALAKINGVEVQDSLLLRDLDKDLYERAKAGEKDAFQQMLDNNQDMINGNLQQFQNIPGMNNVPGMNGSLGTPRPVGTTPMQGGQAPGQGQGAGGLGRPLGDPFGGNPQQDQSDSTGTRRP